MYNENTKNQQIDLW